MAEALPPLRSDLIIEAVAPTEGDPAYDVSSPDLTRTHRVTSQAYLALSMIDGRKDFLGWATAVQQMYPELGLGQLFHLVALVSQLGYFSRPAQLPGSPGGLEGPALIRDLSVSSATGLPSLNYDTAAATLPGTSLPSLGFPDETAQPSHNAPPTEEISPEQAMDMMFAGMGGGLPRGGDAQAPRPVTAVTEMPPGFMQGGATEQGGIFLPDASDASDDMDVDLDFSEGPSAPVGAGAPPAPPRGQGWSAPPTPVPMSDPSLPAQAAPPPSMADAALDPFAMTDPSMAAMNTDSFGPLVGQLPSTEGRGEVPRMWANLAVDRTDSKDIVAVTGPEKGIPFQIYELEHRMLQLMDGTRDHQQLIADISAMGHPIDEGQLMSFIRQMDAYGFLETTGPIERKIERQRMWAPKPPNDSLSKEPWPEEERRLFQVGLGHFRDGRTDKAVSFFEALLEINPDNPEALSMLELIQGCRPTVSALDDTGAGASSAAPGPGGFSAPSLAAPGPGSAGGAPPAGVAGIKNLLTGGFEGGGDFDATDDLPIEEPAPKKKGGGLFRWAALLLILLVGAAVGGLYYELPVTVPVTAQAAGPSVVSVKAPMAGTLNDVSVLKGQSIKKGAPVATVLAGPGAAVNELTEAVAVLQRTLDEQPEEGLSAKEVKSALRTKEKALKKLEAKEAKLNKSVQSKSKRKSRAATKKLKKLMEELTPLRREVNTLLEQKAALDNALSKKELAALKKQLAAKQEELAKVQAEAKTAVLTAPADGIVHDNPPPLKVGTVVTEGQVVAGVRQAGSSVELFVPEAALELAPAGTKVTVMFGAAEVPVVVDGFSPKFETRDGVKGTLVKAQVADGADAKAARGAGTAVLEGPMRPVTIQLLERANSELGLKLPLDF